VEVPITEEITEVLPVAEVLPDDDDGLPVTEPKLRRQLPPRRPYNPLSWIVPLVLATAMVAVLLIAFIVYNATTAPNARCPICGTTFRIEGLDEMVRFQREITFYKCPGCGMEWNGSAYRRTWREDK
jgi:hypothetical protein